MAKPVRRRREKRRIEKGSAHIHSTFNNTIVTIADEAGRPVTGPVPGPWALKVPERAHPLQLKWLRKQQQNRLWNMV